MIDEHETVEMLLPWYVTGRLDRAEVAQVDAHMSKCANCRALLVEERHLKSDVASIPIAVPRCRAPAVAIGYRLSSVSRGWQSTRQTISAWTAKPMRIAAFAAVQVAMMLLMFQLVQPTTPPVASYRTLSSGDLQNQPNAIVMFNADTRESDFRAILFGARANIVGGPTEANAYYLRIDAAKRDSAVDKLRKHPQIMLVQPVDGE